MAELLELNENLLLRYFTHLHMNGDKMVDFVSPGDVCKLISLLQLPLSKEDLMALYAYSKSPVIQDGDQV